ncbi:acyltransferase domain-containing protein, partial [Actinomadura chokoriensis]|uniref:acyltransferase domain-containing protein n=1 Tax=Actinomadura chokoriensis TaxID=454156 RepID=UPI003564B288
LDRVDVVQPVLFAVMVSLAALWRSYGVEPAAVVGHSQGEIAAACVAGALSLQDAAQVVALRSRELAVLAGRGGMVSVSAPVERVRQWLRRWDGRLDVAAINGPGSTVVSGEVPALEELLAECQAEGVRARRVPVDYASHSVQVESLRERLLEVLAGISPRPAAIPFYSTVTAELMDTTGLDADYWYRNLRNTVCFEEAARVVVGAGHGVFVEVSPHPVLTMGVQETLEDLGSDAVVVGSLRRDEGGLGRFLISLGEVFVRGGAVDWEAVFPGRPSAVQLPTYAFQRKRYWLETPAQGAGEDTAVGSGLNPADASFWGAVESGDAQALAVTLGLEGGDARSSLDTLLPVLSSWRKQHRDQLSITSGIQRCVDVDISADSDGGTEANDSSLKQLLVELPEVEQDRVLLDLVRTHAAAVLGHGGPQAVEPTRAFKDLGFESLTAVELRNRLNTATGLHLPPTLIFDYPTPTTLVGLLRGKLLGSPGVERVGGGADEVELRRVLASIPIGRLREAGLVDALLRLANGESEDLTRLIDNKANVIDGLDVEGLVRMAHSKVSDPTRTAES